MSDHEIVESVAAMQILGSDSTDGMGRIKGYKVLQALICRIPLKSTVHNFLAEFDDPSQERLRGQGKSFVPARNVRLDGFDEVTKHILSFVSKRVPHTVVTLDQDATFINTKVAGALFNYKKERSFEALNTYCGEYDMMVHSEFRDGNVTPGFNQLENLKRSLELLPASVEEVHLRNDSAGNQKELLEYCAKGTDKRFKVIRFAVSSNVTDQLKETVSAVPAGEWKKIPEKQHQECADINFVSSDLCTSKNSPEYRYVAIREEVRRQRRMVADNGPGGKPLKLYKTTVPAGSIPERTSETSLIRGFLPSGKTYVPCRQNGNKSVCCRQGKSFRQGGGEDKKFRPAARITAR